MVRVITLEERSGLGEVALGDVAGTYITALLNDASHEST